MANEPELSAIVCTDMICTQAASQALASQGLNGGIKIVTFDATPAAVDMMRQGSIDILVTPKPYDMGYLTVAIATAALDGVTSLPLSLTTGWEILTRPDLDNPSAARWFYTTEAGYPQRSSAGLKIAFVAGIEDPFYYNMQRGAQQAAESLGATLLPQFPRIGVLQSKYKLSTICHQAMTSMYFCWFPRTRWR